jgi:hypothetical protein
MRSRRQPSVIERHAWRRALALLVFKRRIGAAPSRAGRARLLEPGEVALIRRARRGDVEGAMRTLDTPPSHWSRATSRGSHGHIRTARGSVSVVRAT